MLLSCLELLEQFFLSEALPGFLSIVAASNKRKATNGLYVFTLRQLHENVVYKYISISVASILMMLTIMFIANGSATIMSHGNELTRTSAVYDFSNGRRTEC